MGRRLHYDVVIGLGTMCSCSQALREAKLQLLSLPFDWVGGPGIPFKARMMRDDFAGWWSDDGWKKLPEPPHSTNSWWEDKWGFTPLHDFHNLRTFEEQLPDVRARYRRRIDRLNALLDAAKRVLLVYVEAPRYARAEPGNPEEARKILQERWPQVQFDFLILKYVEGVSFADRRETLADGVRTVAYDYRDRGEKEWLADFVAIARWLRAEYAVVDYRTAAEKKAWKARPKQDEYRRYNVRNAFEYVWVKLQFKIYKHLRKRLEKRGVYGI